MKKLISVIFCMIFLVSCSSAPDNISNDIRKYYNELETFTINADITSKLSSRQMDFTVQYTYYSNGPDTGIIISPAEINGIAFNISDTINFNNQVLEMAMKDIKGGTPADMIDGIITDIKNEYPIEISDDKNKITLVYESDILRKSIVLNRQDYTLISTEIFEDGRQILEATFNT